MTREIWTGDPPSECSSEAVIDVPKIVDITLTALRANREILDKLATAFDGNAEIIGKFENLLIQLEAVNEAIVVKGALHLGGQGRHDISEFYGMRPSRLIVVGGELMHSYYGGQLRLFANEVGQDEDPRFREQLSIITWDGSKNVMKLEYRYDTELKGYTITFSTDIGKSIFEFRGGISPSRDDRSDLVFTRTVR